jgi:hypothetical protein
MNSDGVTPLAVVKGYVPHAVLLALRDWTVLTEDNPETGRKKGQKVPGSKVPLDEDWPNTLFESTQNPLYQTKLEAHSGTGVLLGEPSDQLVAIDCDSAAMVKEMHELNPLFEKNPAHQRAARARDNLGKNLGLPSVDQKEARSGISG